MQLKKRLLNFIYHPSKTFIFLVQAILFVLWLVPLLLVLLMFLQAPSFLPLIFILGGFGLFSTFFTVPSLVVWFLQIGIAVFLRRSSIPHIFTYLWFTGSVLSIAAYIAGQSTCGLFCQNGDPFSGSAFIFFVSFSQYIWTPICAKALLMMLDFIDRHRWKFLPKQEK